MNRIATRSSLSQARLQQIVTDLAASDQQWHDLVLYTEYPRWYHRLAAADDHEVWLLSWLPGQGTGFHDHGTAVGAFTVAQGELTERTVPAGRPVAATRVL